MHNVNSATARPYATESEAQADLARLAGHHDGAEAVLQALGVAYDPECLFPLVAIEVGYDDPGHARPRRTDLEMWDGTSQVVVEIKHRAGTDASQLSRYDELIDPAAHLVVVPAIDPHWSEWDTGRRTIRAVTWVELAAGLRASRLREAITVADRLEASVKDLMAVAATAKATTTLRELFDGCDGGDTDGVSDQTSAGRLAGVLSRIVADASVTGPSVDVTRLKYHPPVIVERCDLGDGIWVGWELYGKRGDRRDRRHVDRPGWLQGLCLDLLVWTDGDGVSREVAMKDGLEDRYVAERLVTLAAAAPHFGNGAWGEQAATSLTTRLGKNFRYGIHSFPDEIVREKTGVRCWLFGRPSARSAGLHLWVCPSATFDELVELVRWLHGTVMEVGSVPPAKLSRGAVIPAWDPKWLPGFRRL
jgi:hypothetical protein